jgi:hypothetical protein
VDFAGEYGKGRHQHIARRGLQAFAHKFISTLSQARYYGCSTHYIVSKLRNRYQPFSNAEIAGWYYYGLKAGIVNTTIPNAKITQLA